MALYVWYTASKTGNSRWTLSTTGDGPPASAAAASLTLLALLLPTPARSNARGSQCRKMVVRRSKHCSTRRTREGSLGWWWLLLLLLPLEGVEEEGGRAVSPPAVGAAACGGGGGVSGY